MAVTTEKTGYVNGSDVLVFVGEKAIGHCSSHSMTCNSETKDHTIKPPASAGLTSGLWKGKSVSGLSISVKADGLVFYAEAEYGYKELLGAWKAGKAVTLKCAERSSDTTPYLQGAFVITSLERNDGAQDDSTYSVSFENDGEPSVLDSSKLT